MAITKRELIIAAVVLVVLASVVWFTRRKLPGTALPTGFPTSAPVSQFEKSLGQNFNITIPDDVEKIELRDVGGAGVSGIATRKYTSGKFEHVIIADLDTPAAGEFYQAWLVSGTPGSSSYKIIKTSKLTMEKGGWMIDFQSTVDYSSYNQVIVSLESKNTTAPTRQLLDGSFK